MISPARAPFTLSFSKRGLKDLSSLEPQFQQQVFTGLQEVCLQGIGDIKAMKVSTKVYCEYELVIFEQWLELYKTQFQWLK
jgi:hypothetical protein